MSTDVPFTRIDVGVTSPPFTSTVKAPIGAVIEDKDSLKGIEMISPSVLTVGVPLRVGESESIDAPVRVPPPTVSATTGCGVDCGAPVMPSPNSPTLLLPRHCTLESSNT